MTPEEIELHERKYTATVTRHADALKKYRDAKLVFNAARRELDRAVAARAAEFKKLSKPAD